MFAKDMEDLLDLALGTSAPCSATKLIVSIGLDRLAVNSYCVMALCLMHSLNSLLSLIQQKVVKLTTSRSFRMKRGGLLV